MLQAFATGGRLRATTWEACPPQVATYKACSAQVASCRTAPSHVAACKDPTSAEVEDVLIEWKDWGKMVPIIWLPAGPTSSLKLLKKSTPIMGKAR